jgi:hypothetical protein
LPISPETDPVRVALGDIARLVADAEAAGVALDTWVAELAAELACGGADGAPGAGPSLARAAELAARILADPHASLGAQAHLAASRIASLTGRFPFEKG